jgi:mRNA-degrading endonuclease RelE of RelBE toxin-antitoxin system
MTWSVDYSSRSLKFLKQNHLSEDFVEDAVELALQKFDGEDVNIDVKRLKGEWEGFHRIRSGKLRIIIEFNFRLKRIYIDAIDWRGNVYK